MSRNARIWGTGFLFRGKFRTSYTVLRRLAGSGVDALNQSGDGLPLRQAGLIAGFAYSALLSSIFGVVSASGRNAERRKRLCTMGSDPTREKRIQEEVLPAVSIENVTFIKGL
jgi:hypothetical protein